MSGHWTDHQMVAHLYGIGPDDDHLRLCAECSSKIASLKTARLSVEALQTSTEVSDFEVLAAQRRRIYARISEPQRWQFRRWVSATAALLVIGGSVAIYEQQHVPSQAAQSTVSDAELAEQVASMAEDPEPAPTAPLQGLFE